MNPKPACPIKTFDMRTHPLASHVKCPGCFAMVAVEGVTKSRGFGAPKTEVRVYLAKH